MADALNHIETPYKAIPEKEQAIELWVSKPLTSRDLSISTSATTNVTGSMLFTKGLLKDVDQRTYFREEVFQHLNWMPETKQGLTHLERAYAQFAIYTSGVCQGRYTLRITHNTLRENKSFLQRNGMTGVSWGGAKAIISNPLLVGKTMKLFLVSDAYKLIIE